MRILLLAVGSYGDVLPLAGLAREFLHRGHQVTFFTNPYFANVIQHTGAQFIPVGTINEFQTFINNPKLWHPYQGAKVLSRFMVPVLIRETYQAILPHIVPGSTIIISSFFGWAARIIQETQGIPHASAFYVPSNIFSGHASPKGPNFHFPCWLPPWIKRQCWAMVNHAFIDPLVKQPVNLFRHELGLPPVSQFLHGWSASQELILGMFPDWFAQPQPDWPPYTVLTGFPLYDDVHDAVLPDSIQKFLAAYPEPIVCTPGSVNKHGHMFFQEALKACQILERPGIFLTRFQEQLPPSLPNSIQHFSYAPLSTLLPQCSALLHHGGIGTCAQAIRAGIPQLIHPLGFDQFDNADRVEQLGIGSTVFRRSFHSSTIATKLQDLLRSSHIRTQCRFTSEQVKSSHGLGAACDAIEAHLMKPSPPKSI